MTRKQVGFTILNEEGECGVSALRDRIGAAWPQRATLVHDVSDLASSAAVFFRGHYPVEAPYFHWGNALRLPWHHEYSGPENGQSPSAPRSISYEVKKILRLLSPGLTSEVEELECANTYLSTALCASPKLKVQGLAVETMWSVDQCLLRMVEIDCSAAMHSLSVAYKNLLECTCQAQLLLGVAQPDAQGGSAAFGVSQDQRVRLH